MSNWFDKATGADDWSLDSTIKQWTNDARGVITGATGSARQYKYQKKLAAQQYAYDVALQEDSQSFNSEEAQKSRDYQTEMSNSAYQRQRADLEAAGYNPLLAINSGGASTPSGATASSSAQSVGQGSATAGESQLGTLVSMFSTFGALAKLGSEIENNRASAASHLSTADLANSQSEESSARARLYDAQTFKTSQEALGIDPEARRTKEKYGEGPFGFTHSVSGLADAAAKGASKVKDAYDKWSTSSATSPSATSAKSAQKKMDDVERTLSDILDSVLGSEKTPKGHKPKSSFGSQFQYFP